VANWVSGVSKMSARRPGPSWIFAAAAIAALALFGCIRKPTRAEPGASDANATSAAAASAGAKAAYALKPNVRLAVRGLNEPVQTALDGAAKQFKSMPVVYRKPTSLPFGKPSPFSLVIASADLQAARARAAQGNPGVEVVQSATLSDRVEADLQGDPSVVDIHLDGDAIRDVSSAANVTWTWSVQPKLPQPITLTVSLYNHVTVDGQDHKIEGRAYTDTFTVPMTGWQTFMYGAQQFGRLWGWIGAAVVAVGGAIGWWLRRRSAKA
jgi:hypothetical protein